MNSVSILNYFPQDLHRTFSDRPKFRKFRRLGQMVRIFLERVEFAKFRKMLRILHCVKIPLIFGNPGKLFQVEMNLNFYNNCIDSRMLTDCVNEGTDTY